MTSKEKAAHLFKEMKFCVWKNDQALDDEEAKQCALTTVDEIIAVCKTAGTLDYRIPFWQEVKKEIEAL